MFSALYYPHTKLRGCGRSTERLLKRALLFWDELEFIVPYRDFYSEHDYHDRRDIRDLHPDPAAREGVDLLRRDHVPSQVEKEAAHSVLEEIVTRPNLPETLFYSEREESPYEIYARKLLPETWELLEKAHFARPVRGQKDYALAKNAGLLIMAILADECAGATKCRVTDRAQVYAGLASLLAGDQSKLAHGTKVDRLVDLTFRAEGRPRKEETVVAQETVVAMNLNLLDVDKLTFSQLVEFRKREFEESGHHIRDLRHRYIQRIEDQIRRIATDSSLTASDEDTLEKEFLEDMKDDLAFLKDELRAESWQLVLSKEVIATIIASVGTIAAALLAAPVVIEGAVTVTGAPASVIGIVAARNKFLKARSEILRRHPMAYLYELGGVKSSTSTWKKIRNLGRSTRA